MEMRRLGNSGLVVSELCFGATTRKQLEEDLEAAELDLSADETERLDGVGEVPKPYPHWHLEMTGADRRALLGRQASDRAQVATGFARSVAGGG